jgi:hypothetical protein
LKRAFHGNGSILFKSNGNTKPFFVVSRKNVDNIGKLQAGLRKL